MLLDAGETKATDPNINAHSEGVHSAGWRVGMLKIVPLENTAWGEQERMVLGDMCNFFSQKSGQDSRQRKHTGYSPQVTPSGSVAQKRNGLETQKDKQGSN